MEIAFGLFVVVVLAIGLLNRRKGNKAWVKEERYDESGAWIDKRTGERGTYGSLDAEREQERREVVQQGRIHELSRRIRDYAFEHYPGFHTLSDAQIRDYNTFIKKQVAALPSVIKRMMDGTPPGAETQSPGDSTHIQAVQKLILDFLYAEFPALLDMEIEALKQLDRFAAVQSGALVEKIEEMKSEKA